MDFKNMKGISSQTVGMLLDTVLRKNGASLQKNKLSPSQKQGLKQLVQNLQNDVETIVNTAANANPSSNKRKK